MIQPLTDRDFQRVQQFVRDEMGIHLSDAKRQMVSGRLMKRLSHHGFSAMGAYLDLVIGGRDPAERQVAIDLLTTHETHFFREPKHFEFLDALARAPETRRPLRVWSAACSTGEEPYSIAMVLENALGTGGWELFASDIAMATLDKAAAGHYPIEGARTIPEALLKRYCLKGVGSQEGYFIVDAGMRKRVRFAAVNLTAISPSVGTFEVIFLRNVMIYFDMAVKRQVVSSLLERLVPGGYLIIGHTETLHGVVDGITPVKPSVYRKDAR